MNLWLDFIDKYWLVISLWLALLGVALIWNYCASVVSHGEHYQDKPKRTPVTKRDYKGMKK